MTFTSAIRTMAGATVALTFFGCSKHEHHDHDHHAGSGHVHRAPHGGTLVELGEHHYNLELVRDPATGALTAFVLDGHAEMAVRIGAADIELVIDRSGTTETVTLFAVANPLSNETVGDTSEFVGQAEWLANNERFTGRIREITVRGTTYRDVPFAVW